jgi:MoeA N-terminal region (domain I and II)
MSQDAKSKTIVDAVRRAARQEQFLEVVSAAEARRRFEARLDRAPLAGESVPFAAALARVIAADVIAPIDTPPFDRANVDGFALRAADTLGAGPGTPKRLTLNREVIACGVAPTLEVASGTATAIATGGVIPRGADAVMMVEHTELIEDGAAPAIDVHRAVTSGQFISYAGSDIARGETLLRRGAAPSRRAMPINRARTMPSLPRLPSTVPIGAWRSNPSRSRRSTTISWWSRRDAAGRRSRPLWRCCATGRPATASARLAWNRAARSSAE